MPESGAAKSLANEYLSGDIQDTHRHVEVGDQGGEAKRESVGEVVKDVYGRVAHEFVENVERVARNTVGQTASKHDAQVRSLHAGSAEAAGVKIADRVEGVKLVEVDDDRRQNARRDHHRQKKTRSTCQVHSHDFFVSAQIAGDRPECRR